MQNTDDADAHMMLMAWSLELATREMSLDCDKYVVYINLENFSIFNSPPITETVETIHMLCSCYPERMGHIVFYQPPLMFIPFYEAVKGFIDQKSISKAVFVRGDVSEGSVNDVHMKSLIGPNWKDLTGSDRPKCNPASAPGYDHDKFWPKLMSRVCAIQARERRDDPSLSFASLKTVSPDCLEENESWRSFDEGDSDAGYFSARSHLPPHDHPHTAKLSIGKRMLMGLSLRVSKDDAFVG